MAGIGLAAAWPPDSLDAGQAINSAILGSRRRPAFRPPRCRIVIHWL